ncbi:MAG: hypothetical protein QXJ32_01260 [Thermoplasmata archaeon]
MAKKRKKEKKEEEYEFTPPDFDEKEFLMKELKDTKVALATVGFAILAGAIAGVISMVSRALVGAAFLVAIAGIFSLRYYYKLLKIDITAFTKKNWVGNVATYFFTFLAIWVLLLNAPFSDLADPSIDSIEIFVHDVNADSWQAIEYKRIEALGGFVWVFKGTNNSVTPTNTPIHASNGYIVNITARVTDNGKLSYAEIAVGAEVYARMTASSDHRYQHVINGSALNASTGLTFTIRAVDDHGNENTFTPVRPVPVLP